MAIIFPFTVSFPGTGLANDGPDLAYVPFYKVLLEQSHAFSLLYCLSLLLCCDDGAE